MIIGLINFLSSISRFDNARILDKIVKQSAILGVSLLIFLQQAEVNLEISFIK